MGVVDNEGRFAYVGHNGCMESLYFLKFAVNLKWL